jgi:hypothetical protein
VLLAAGMEGDLTLEHRVDLLLAVSGVIVLGMAVGVRRKAQDLHSERGHAQARTGLEKASPERCLEVLRAPHGDIGHGPTLQPRPRVLATRV